MCDNWSELLSRPLQRSPATSTFDRHKKKSEHMSVVHSTHERNQTSKGDRRLIVLLKGACACFNPHLMGHGTYSADQ